MNITYYWLIAFAVLAVIEMFTQGLTTIWFAIGCVFAAVFAALGLPFILQMLIFASVSLVLLIFIRAIAVEFLSRNKIRTNSESLIGKQAVVVEEINNLEAVGQVVVNGQQWSARSVNDMMVIEKGEVVIIHAIQGVKLIVGQVPQYQYSAQKNE